MPMSRPDPRSSSNGQLQQRRRMLRQTEAFLNQRMNGAPTSRHRGGPVDDRRSDPRRTDETPRRSGESAEAARAARRLNTLVRVPADEHGHLDESLLDRWGLYLSRLIEMPHRGDVMLDLADVVSLPPRFLQVYQWLRRHLADHGRRVLLQAADACLEDPEPTELARFVRVM
jgi:hypothetical protein